MPERPQFSETEGRVIPAVEYGFQRDNPVLSGGGLLLHGWDDCAYEMNGMVISQKIPKATDNAFVVSMIKDMEPALTPNGWGADFLKKNRAMLNAQGWAANPRIGAYVECNAAYCEYKTGVKAVLRKYDGTWNEIIALVYAGRAVGFCSKLTGAGHYIVIAGVRFGPAGKVDALICMDPYGKARFNPDGSTTYVDTDGAWVTYPLADMKRRHIWGDDMGEHLTYFYLEVGK